MRKETKMKYVYSIGEIAEQRKKDSKELAVLWDNLAAEAGGGEKGAAVADAFRKLYSMYGSSLVNWSATLYDKGHGCYYTSSVGRDTDGFLPDIESTVQMLRFIEGSGMLRECGNNWATGIPRWMLHEIAYYAKSLQDENGFFYHAHWAKETADELISRRARDLGWATQILAAVGDAPQYDTPSGIPGNGKDADELWASFNTELPPPPAAAALFHKKRGAVRSTAEKAADQKRSGDSVAYLKSHTAFADYLRERLIPGMKKNPYFFGNEIGETYRQVAAFTKKLGKYEWRAEDGDKYSEYDGMNISDILIHELDKAINPDTGMWGDLRPTKPTGKEFLYTNGFMKGMAAYNGLRYPYPKKYLSVVANALMDSLLGDEPSTGNICEVYNSWTSVCRLRENLQYVDDESLKREIVDSFNSILIEKAPEAILNTYEKIKGYKKADGGFAHSYYRGTPDHQGMPISTTENAGDVDATCIGSTGLTRVMFEALGLTRVPILMTSDWMNYLNILENLEPVSKIKSQKAIIDFEDGSTHTAFGVDGGSCSVIPFEGSRAMKVTSKASGAGLKVTPTARLYDGDYFLFEAALHFPKESEGAEYALSLTNSKGEAPVYAKIAVTKEKITVSCPELGLKKELALGDVGKTFTLKLEYRATVGESSELSIFSDGKPVATLKNTDTESSEHPAGYPARAITGFKLITLTDTECAFFIDDIIFFFAK